MGYGALLGALGGLGGGAAASVVDPKYAPLAELVTNATIQGTGGLMRPRIGAGVDPAAAEQARVGMSEGVPFRAPDITPGSRYRTPEQMALTTDALTGNMIREMDLDPKTGVPATENHVDPTLIGKAKTLAGGDMNAITNNNDIGPGQTFDLLTKLRQADRDVDNIPDISPSDRALMRQRIANIRQAIDMKTGTLSGSDYQSLTQTGSPLDMLQASGKTDIANMGRRLNGYLDQAFRASLSQDDAAAYSDAKMRYRLASSLEPLAEKYQGRRLPMDEVADHLYTAQQKYGATPPGQPPGALDRFLQQSSLIAGGPTPYAPSIVQPILQNPTGLAVGLGSGQVAPAALQFAGPVSDVLFGGLARSKYRMNDVIAATQQQQYITKLRQALGGLASSTIP
jgi:hypothetical protein